MCSPEPTSGRRAEPRESASSDNPFCLWVIRGEETSKVSLSRCHTSRPKTEEVGPYLGRVSLTRVALNGGREKTGVPHFSRFSKRGPPSVQHHSGSDSSRTKTIKVTIGNLCRVPHPFRAL